MNNRLLVGLFLLAGIAGAAAYYVTMKPGAVTPSSATADATTEPATGAGDAAGAAPGASQLAATIPAFQLADQDGVMRSLKDDWTGKALIVNFWAASRCSAVIRLASS